jgi:hypothetical protein
LTAFVTHWFTTPAWTTMRRFARSIASMACRRLVQIMTGAPNRQRAAREPGAGAARDEGHVRLGETADDVGDGARGPRQNDQLGRRPLQRVAVAVVDPERIGMIDDTVVADERAETRGKRRRAHRAGL